MKYIASLVLICLVQFSWAVQDPSFAKVKTELDKHINKENHNIEFEILSHTTGSQSVEHYYGVQVLQGKQIHGVHFNMSFKNNELVNIHHNLIVNPSAILSQAQTTIDYKGALQSLVDDVALSDNKWVRFNENEYHYADANLSSTTVKVKAKWYVLNKELIPIYEVSLYELDQDHWYVSRVNALDASLIDRDDLIVSCQFDGYDHPSDIAHPIPGIHAMHEAHKTHAEGSYKVFARPTESPNHGARTLVVDPHDTVASPFGWHDVNGATNAEFTITRGNNAYAFDNSNGATNGQSPDGGSSLIFDDTFNINQSAALFKDASVTNLFYWNNQMHDVWYQYGFDEISGNFQANNYGNGGAGGDAVNAQAQDGAGTNNASFGTPDDGSAPTMRMFIWNSNASTGEYFQVNSPASIAGKYTSSVSTFAPALNTTPITADLVEAVPLNACAGLSNAAAINGKIAFIKRGGCTFVEKVRNAQNAGALAAVLYDSTANDPISLGGTANDITIPVVMIRRADGEAIRPLIGAGVNVSLFDSATAGNIVFDSDFDAGVISHEYGHGISNRLTGGPTNSGCLQNQEQMGEGWSDFFGLVMTHEPGDAATDIRGIGTYVTNQSVTGGGIRPYPYSTNMGVSLYTYDDIKSLSVPHGVGSVWCAMLWDLYWAFIDEYGFDSDIYRGTGGNNMAMQLVIDGLKLQPCGPGFEDGRDAILLADELNYNSANQKLIWEVFARRGLGYSADQGSSGSRSDGTEAFDLPPFNLIVEKRAASEVVNGDNLDYSLVAKNLSGETIFNIVLKDTLPKGLFINSVPCATTFMDRIITINIDSLQHQDSFVCSFSPEVKFEQTTSVLESDDMESGTSDWDVQSDQGSNNWKLSQARKNSGSNSWYVQDIETQSDQSLIHEYDITGTAPVLSFFHFYRTEDTWDGGVVEIWDGTSWQDADSLFLLNGYNSTIQTNQASAISDRRAFSGNSGKFVESKIDLTAYLNTTIKVRFRFASDAALGSDGWYIDDVEIQDATQIQNFLTGTHDPNKRVRTSSRTFVTGEGIELGVEDLGISDPTIYPNPASEVLYVEIDGEDVYDVVLLDLNGRTVLNWEGQAKAELDISSLTAGSYIVEVITQEGAYRKKIMVE